MINQELNQVIKHWHYIAPVIHPAKNAKEYRKLIKKLDELLLIVGNNENHSLIGLIDVISHFVEEYEMQHYSKEQEAKTGIEALKFLMQAHHINQSDLPEIGSQGVVSEILNGKRELNIKQIIALSKRFSVNPTTFIDY